MMQRDRQHDANSDPRRGPARGQKPGDLKMSHRARLVSLIPISIAMHNIR
jgi:hypothetical protein